MLFTKKKKIFQLHEVKRLAWIDNIIVIVIKVIVICDDRLTLGATRLGPLLGCHVLKIVTKLDHIICMGQLVLGQLCCSLQLVLDLLLDTFIQHLFEALLLPLTYLLLGLGESGFLGPGAGATLLVAAFLRVPNVVYKLEVLSWFTNQCCWCWLLVLDLVHRQCAKSERLGPH